MNAEASSIRTVLFDLDGTLVDTAPEIAAALNDLLRLHSRATLPISHIRPVVSAGTGALIRMAFPEAAEETSFLVLREQLLRIYHDQYLLQSKLFSGISEVLDELDSQGLGWGIVTNKISWLTEPLVKALGLDRKTPCVVSGDTASYAKPHPAPLLHAARLLDTLPARCVYVGDAETDVIAGRAAGMLCLVATYGYLAPDVDVRLWHANGLLAHPQGLQSWLATNQLDF